MRIGARYDQVEAGWCNCDTRRRASCGYAQDRPKPSCTGVLKAHSARCCGTDLLQSLLLLQPLLLLLCC